MSSNKKIERSHPELWKEEQASLLEQIKIVPYGGTIVELGTANGLTTILLAKCTSEKNVQIYTIDLSPSKTAYKTLNSSNVNIIQSDSSCFAKKWEVEHKQKIDFLLIDGDHSFLGIYKDFYSWIPHLNPGAVLAIHDYDPPERGGIAHLGVWIFIKTLIENLVLKDVLHSHRFCFCSLNGIRSPNLPLENFFNTFIKIGTGINKVAENIFKKSINNGIELIKKRYMKIDSLQACYLILILTKDHRNVLINSSNNKNETRFWIENLQMLKHAYGSTFFPDNVKNMPVPSDETEMSKLIAREHIKIQCSKNILKTIVSWTL